MKKILTSIIAISLLAMNAYCKTLVAYFSCTGNTAQLAKQSAEVLGADLFEIVPVEKYTQKDLDWNDRNSRSTKECNDPKCRPEIESSIDLTPYDTIVLAYPIWWGYAPKIIYTFVEKYDLSGKTVLPICTSGGSNIGNSGKSLSSRASKRAKFLQGRRFSQYTTKEELTRYYNEVFN